MHAYAHSHISAPLYHSVCAQSAVTYIDAILIGLRYVVQCVRLCVFFWKYVPLIDISNNHGGKTFFESHVLAGTIFEYV